MGLPSWIFSVCTGQKSFVWLLWCRLDDLLVSAVPVALAMSTALSTDSAHSAMNAAQDAFKATLIAGTILLAL
jgi:hypothetical protein